MTHIKWDWTCYFPDKSPHFLKRGDDTYDNLKNAFPPAGMNLVALVPCVCVYVCVYHTNGYPSTCITSSSTFEGKRGYGSTNKSNICSCVCVGVLLVMLTFLTRSVLWWAWSREHDPSRDTRIQDTISCRALVWHTASHRFGLMEVYPVAHTFSSIEHLIFVYHRFRFPEPLSDFHALPDSHAHNTPDPHEGSTHGYAAAAV